MISFKGKVAVLGVSISIALYAVIGSYLSTHAQQPINDAGAQMRIFGSVLQHIQNDYVDEPDWEKVRAGALRGLPSGLDAYSSYLTEDQVKNFASDRFTKEAGIGAEFSQVASYLYIVSVVSGSPADKAGLKSGDVVEFIENKDGVGCRKVKPVVGDAARSGIIGFLYPRLRVNERADHQRECHQQ